MPTPQPQKWYGTVEEWLWKLTPFAFKPPCEVCQNGLAVVALTAHGRNTIPQVLLTCRKCARKPSVAAHRTHDELPTQNEATGIGNYLQDQYYSQGKEPHELAK